MEKNKSLATATDEQASVNTSKTTSGTALDNSISNSNPKSNTSKEKFSLDSPVEETNDLIAVHNLTEEELLKILKFGGFHMPSIVVVKDSYNHNEYGAVSVLFNKKTIDPKANKQNKVYGGDAWTPTYPTIEYTANEKHLKELEANTMT